MLILEDLNRSLCVGVRVARKTWEGSHYNSFLCVASSTFPAQCHIITHPPNPPQKAKLPSNRLSTRINPVHLLSQPILKPSNSLLERILHGVHILLHAHIRPQRKAMVNASIDIDLVRDIQVNQDLLSFVAILTGEDVVDFCPGCCC